MTNHMVHMTFSYEKVNDQIYFKKFYHLPPLSNLVFTLSYTWSYIPIVHIFQFFVVSHINIL
jgi:hypothetical protein